MVSQRSLPHKPSREQLRPEIHRGAALLEVLPLQADRATQADRVSAAE